MRAIRERGMQMRSVKVKRDELLSKVKANKDKHVAQYKEAVEGYKEEALKQIEKATVRLKRQVQELETGETLRLAAIHFDLRVPENHEKDYEQVIQMLQMSVDEELDIKADEFACYVMDDWGWKEDFLEVSRAYKK